MKLFRTLEFRENTQIDLVRKFSRVILILETAISFSQKNDSCHKCLTYRKRIITFLMYFGCGA